MEQNRSTQADMQRWGQTIPAAPRRTQSVAGNWQQSARSAKLRPPIQQPEIGAWLDSVRAQLDPAPPEKKLEVERALIAGVAAGLLLLLSGSIYWFSASNSKKDEPVVVVAGSASTNATDQALAIGVSTPRQAAAPRSEVPVWETRVPRVTEEALTTLPVENDNSPARRTMTVALTENAPDRTSSTDSKIADTNSAPVRAEEPKAAEPKAPRREPAPASARPQPDKPPATKLALAEPVAAPVQSVAVTPPMPSSAPTPVIAMPRLKFMREPNYPISEMRAGHSGTTTLELLVLESGLVGEVTVLSSSGYPKLDEAAVTVAKRSWKFFPATEDGKPMAMKIEAPVRFSLD